MYHLGSHVREPEDDPRGGGVTGKRVLGYINPTSQVGIIVKPPRDIVVSYDSVLLREGNKFNTYILGRRIV